MSDTQSDIAPGDGDADAAAAAAAAADQGGQGGEGGDWAAPDYVPEAFRGESAEDTLKRLSDAYSSENKRAEDLRAKLGKQPAMPKTADEYVYEPSDALKPYFGDDDETKTMMGFAREAALKNGIPADSFGKFIEDVYGPAIEKGLLPPPFDPAKELEGFSEYAGDRAADKLQAAYQFAEGLGNQLAKDDALDEATQELIKGEMLGLTNTKGGNILLDKMMGWARAGGRLPLGGDGGDTGAMTEEEANALVRDPRIDPRNRDHEDPKKRFDPALRKRLDAFYAKQDAEKAG